MQKEKTQEKETQIEAVKQNPSGLYVENSPMKDVLKELEGIHKEVHALTLVPGIRGTTLDDPFVLPLAKKDNHWYGGQPMFYILNSPLVGLLANPDDDKNPFKNALRLAEMLELPYLIISGNLIHLDVTQASKNQALRAMATDTQGLEKNGTEELFQTMDERIRRRIKRAKELMMDENGKPIFSGKFFFAPGKSEMNIINYWVAEEARRVTAQQRDIVSKGIQETRKEIGARESLCVRLEKPLAELERLLVSEDKRKEKNLTKAELLEEKRKCLENLKFNRSVLESRYEELALLRDKRAAIRQTDLTEVVRKKWYLNFCEKLADIFEEEFLNFKVISTGDVFLKAGEITAKLVQNPHDANSDTYMNRTWERVNNALHNGDRQPDYVFIGGYNLTYERYDSVYPARDPFDERKTTTVEIIQLPMCVDSDYLKSNFEHTVAIGPFITRLAENPFFAAGMVNCGRISKFSVRDFVTLDTLTDAKFCTDKSALSKLTNGKYMVYGELRSDPQEGSRYQAWYDLPDPPYMVVPYVLHHRAFIEWDAPISWEANLGDIVQGENFPMYHLEDPDEYMHAYDVEKRIEKLLADSAKDAKTLIKQRNELIRLWQQNAKNAGTTRVDEQLESYWQRAYKDQSQYYAGIIKRSQKIGLATIGRLGIISKISGNHFQNTGLKSSGGVGWHFDEAILSVKELINVLGREHKFDDDLLQKLVQAPRGSAKNVSILAGGLGLLSDKDYASWIKNSRSVAPEKFPYCISAKHKPGKGGSRKVNPIVAMRRVRSLKGTTDPIYQDRFVIELAGHINRDSEALLPNGLCKLVPCDGEFQTPYAQELDFGLGDVGTAVLGLPMHRRGFFRTISFSYEGFRAHIQNGKKWKVDVKALFRNSF